MPQNPDVLIVGGGIIGLTAAYFMAREGLHVTVVDKGDFGQEASWAGAGILPPSHAVPNLPPIDQLAAHSTALFPTLSNELRERTGMDNGYLRCGGLEIDASTTDESEWRRQNVDFEMVEEKKLKQLEPTLSPSIRRACFIPEMAQLRNPRHLKALLAACVSIGVWLHPGCPIYYFEGKGSRIAALQSAAGPLVADRYLLAAGAWSEALLKPLGWTPGIKPIRGQIALLNTGAPVVHRILMQGKRYLVPRPDSRVLIGSTEEGAGFDKRNTAAAIADLLAFATTLVPDLAVANLERCWAGLRPGTPDGLPFIGAVPGMENLFVATGHQRAGILLSPATAMVLTELFTGKPLTVPLDAFRLDRK